MPARSYIKTRTRGYNNIVQEYLNTVWGHSPRDAAGRLALRDNALTRERFYNVSFNYNIVELTPYLRPAFPYSVTPYGIPALGISTDSLQSATYAMLRSQLYKGSAALGVTFGSWKQSQDMIVARYRQMSFQADQYEARARRIIDWGNTNPRRRRAVSIKLNKLGSQYLETVFGWQPLLSDIHAACRTVIDTQPAVRRVKARAQTYIDQSVPVHTAGLSPPVLGRGRVVGHMRLVRAATIEVSNPNLWLQERAGLLNPAAVAWDLVPWSFVVNMFVNTGQLVNSITDFAGLTNRSSSITTSIELNHRELLAGRLSPKLYGVGSTDYACRLKYRALGGLSIPPLVFKLPNLNWELAAIAASLFTQKFKAANTLLLTMKRS